jgi:hypothetical protein
MKSRTKIQCKNMTKRGDFCTSHQGRNLGVKVAKSQIKNGGLGLYTTVPRKKDQKIADYTGKVTTFNPPNDSDYVLQLTKDRFVDAENPLTSGYARYANDAKKKDLPLRNNAKFSYNRTKKECVLKANKNIKANSEVMVPYGAGYWAP